MNKLFVKKITSYLGTFSLQAGLKWAEQQIPVTSLFFSPKESSNGVYSLGVTAASRDLIVSAIWMMDCADCGALLPQIAPPRLIDMGNSILLK